MDLAGCGKARNESLTFVEWLQFLIGEGQKESLMLLGVTQGLESYQNRSINLSGASRAGLYRMIQSEYSHLQSRHMDADPTMDDCLLAKQIANEFLIDDDNSEICYRQGIRYRAHLLDCQAKKGRRKSADFSEKNVLWITGGTRGLGYLCAEHFVKNYGVKRLVLTGKEALPPRDQWSSYAGQTDSISKKICAIQALEGQGIEVRVLAIPLSDKALVQENLQDIKKQIGTNWWGDPLRWDDGFRKSCLYL